MRYIVPIMLLFVSSMTYSSQQKSPRGESSKPPSQKTAQELTAVTAVLQAHPTSPAGTKAPGEYRDAHPTSPPRPPKEEAFGKDTKNRPAGKAPGEHHDHLQRRGSGGDCSTDPPPVTRSPQHTSLQRPGCGTEPPKGKVSPQPQPRRVTTGADALGVNLARDDKNLSPPVAV